MKTNSITQWGLGGALSLGLLLTQSTFSQTNLQFTGANATPENAIQLHWASKTNEVYEIDYANQLATNADGSTAWHKLYDDYPSHGTNTFVADAGNYDLTPEIPHPKFSPMRFYRVMLVENNSSASNPTISIISPTNGALLSGVVTFRVSASSPEILTDIRLYIDGEEQWSSNDNSNFVINTCEWLNGNHTIFATAKSQSGLEGAANGATITYGRAVSSYVNVVFNNLISGFNFSQTFFEPALGQTQQVTAIFAANCNWTLQIQNENSNTVRTVAGSGVSMQFNWNGTGDGGVAIPNGVYTYVLSAQTNGQAFQNFSEGGDWGGGSGIPLSPSLASALSGTPAYSTELLAMPADGSGTAVPLAIYPPGFDTNALIIFEGSMADFRPQRMSFARAESFNALDSDGTTSAASNLSSQNTSGPTRKHKVGVKGAVGSFGILYKSYGVAGFTSQHPTTGWPYPLPTLVAIDDQSRTAQTQDKRIWNYPKIANDFEQGMIQHDWKRAFLERDDQWNAVDIKKTSLGGHSIFNTCTFGLLMTHGSFGNNNSQGTESDNIKYSYVWLGANNYVRLSDMDFGGADPTNGLRWMTIYACNILNPANYNSMNNAGKIPVNENLHLLLGPSTTAYSCSMFGSAYALNLTLNNRTVIQAFNEAGGLAHTFDHAPTPVKFAACGWQSCFGDKLLFYNDPDGNGLQYLETSIYTP